MTMTSTMLLHWIYGYFFPFFRIAAMLMVMPVFGSQLIPMQIRLVFALLLTMMVAPLLSVESVVAFLSWRTFIIIFQQLLIGIAAGLVFQFVFQVFIFAGQIIAMQSGLGFASMIDPASNVTVPLVSQFYLLIITMIFLSLNGHIVLLQVIVQSFDLFPISTKGFSGEQIRSFVQFGSVLFSGATVIALPATLVLLLINLIFSVITRASPQFNIFTVGFGLTLIASLIVIYLTIRAVQPQFEQFSEQGFSLLTKLLRAY